MHAAWDRITALLNEKFPKSFTCKRSKYGQADVLRVKCSTRAGSAIIFSPDHNEGLLLSLEETDQSQNDDDDEDDALSENWYAKTPEEIVQRIQPWAFPPPRNEPRPIDRGTQKKYLELLAKGIASRQQNVECVVSKPSPVVVRQLTEEAQKKLYHDLESLSTARIVRNFPWDSAGRLLLETSVLLSIFELKELARGPNARSGCLAAIGPERRRDRQVIRVELTNLIVLNQSHRWENCPWLWNDAEVPLNGADTPKAARSLQLLDDGKIEKALAVFGVTLSDDLHRLLGAERICLSGSHPDAAWTNLLIERLRESAPWLLPRAVKDAAEKSRTAKKKNRRLEPPMLKFVIFPGEVHARKACLFLTGDKDGGNPRFVIDATASNARLHETAWKRPVEVDFKRYDVPFDQGKEARPAPSTWPSTVVQLADALSNGQDCGFALHDALLDTGYSQLAQHFQADKKHPKGCWALGLLLGMS